MAVRPDIAAGLEQIEALLSAGEPLSISAADLGQGARVLMGAGTKMMSMTPTAARRVADSFDTPAARAAGLTVADDLRDAADAADRYGATIQ